MRHRLVTLLLSIALAAVAAPAAAQDPWAAFTTPSAGLPQPIGGYANGCLDGGVALPLQGIGYQVVRASRNRYYGHPALIAFIEDLAYRAHQQGLGEVLVGDMGLPRGGPMPNGHRSHQIGLDADIWLRLDAPVAATPQAAEAIMPTLMVPTGTFAVDRSVWGAAQEALVREAALDPRVARIFVHPAIKAALCQTTAPDRSWLRTVRPWWGHDSHFHIRLHCPEDALGCIPQAPPPEGDGCGAELAGWFPDPHRPPVAEPAAPRLPPPLPAACQALLATWQATGQ